MGPIFTKKVADVAHDVALGDGAVDVADDQFVGMVVEPDEPFQFLAVALLCNGVLALAEVELSQVVLGREQTACLVVHVLQGLLLEGLCLGGLPPKQGGLVVLLLGVLDPLARVGVDILAKCEEGEQQRTSVQRVECLLPPVDDGDYTDHLVFEELVGLDKLLHLLEGEPALAAFLDEGKVHALNHVRVLQQLQIHGREVILVHFVLGGAPAAALVEGLQATCVRLVLVDFELELVGVEYEFVPGHVLVHELLFD